MKLSNRLRLELLLLLVSVLWVLVMLITVLYPMIVEQSSPLEIASLGIAYFSSRAVLIVTIALLLDWLIISLLLNNASSIYQTNVKLIFIVFGFLVNFIILFLKKYSLLFPIFFLSTSLIVIIALRSFIYRIGITVKAVPI